MITTTSGHHLLYSISLYNPQGGSGSKRGVGANSSNSAVYVVPGGDKGARAWPAGPGEGHALEGVVLRYEGERGMAVGDGVGW